MAEAFFAPRMKRDASSNIPRLLFVLVLHLNITEMEKKNVESKMNVPELLKGSYMFAFRMVSEIPHNNSRRGLLV